MHAMAASNLHFLMILIMVAAAMVVSPVQAAPTMNPQPARPMDKLLFRNKLPGFLNVHCFKSNAYKDLHLHPVAPGEEYMWEFDMNFWGTTSYYCNFHYVGTKMWQAFMAWNGPGFSGGTPYIRQCIWEVNLDGFFRAKEGFPLIIIHPWRQDPENSLIEAQDPESPDRKEPESP